MIKLLRFVFMYTALCFSLLQGTTFAQELPVTVTNDSWNSEFREHLTFNLTASADTTITEAYLFYKIVGQVATSRNVAEFTPGPAIEAVYEIDQTQPANYMPPGAQVQYWWKLVDGDGNEFKTDKQQLTYLDNRYEWSSKANDRLTLYWYNGDDAFGQALFDRANLALDTLEEDIGITIEDPIQIFIYGGHEDLLNALSTASQEWTGGVAFTEFGVVVIGINPIQLDWGLQAMTHEMTHLVIHQATDNPYSDLPRWLDEGIAVHNEDKDELVADFQPVLDKAIANDTAMTLRTLSSPFPSDPMAANLAYGQSGAVVKYMVKSYGPEAMAKLLEIFSEGALYDEALQEALGVTMDEIDNGWRVSVGLPPLPGVALPEAVTTEEPTFTVEPTESANEVAAVPATTQAETAPVSPPDTASESSSGLPCLPGLWLLFGFGAVLAWRRPVG